MISFLMSRYQLPELQELRAIKSAREVSYIVKAQRTAEVVLIEVLRKLKVGVSEVQLARYIVAAFKRRGVKALAFEPIVAFGKGSADIHHWATKTRLQQNQIVMFDFGCTVQGYCSDMTRTFWFGNPTAKFKRVYQAVLAAQEKSLRLLVRGERRTKVIDAAARLPIVRKFGKRAFPHGLGHGVGIAIHEWPNFTPKSRDVLQSGVVMTVEPGVYIKGWGGVRIEDMVLVKRRGARNLTKAPKSFGSATLRV